MSRYLIVGGTGFIGNAITKELLTRFDPWVHVCIFSRSESNQHYMRTRFLGEDRLSFFIGDIRDKNSLRKCIKAFRPTTIIVSAALKRIDVCEEHPIEALKTNTEGLENVCSLAIEEDGIEKILYTSTDKASDPINTYGNTKALGERIMMNYAKIAPIKKFCVTRYGNVLESTGSVIPIFRDLIAKGKDITLRGDASRFILDEKQAVKTVMDSLFHADGPILIPKCKAMRIKDLADVMMEKANKQVKIITQPLLPCEKQHETLISENEWKYVSKETDDYYQLNPNHSFGKTGKYASNQNVLTKDALRKFLESKGIL